MKITLDQDTLAKAVISYLQGVGVQSDILGVEFRYTRVPYTVFAEVELAEAKLSKPAKTRSDVEISQDLPEPVLPKLPEPLVDPTTLPADETPEESDQPAPEKPAAPLFGGGG
jgi:hypothetical protein